MRLTQNFPSNFIFLRFLTKQTKLNKKKQKNKKSYSWTQITTFNNKNTIIIYNTENRNMNTSIKHIHNPRTKTINFYTEKSKNKKSHTQTVNLYPKFFKKKPPISKPNYRLQSMNL